jgi:[acyl-carrier-protein] S-malonyltransferase
MAAAAGASEQTSMAAVLGGDPDTVEEVLAGLGLTAANVNGGGQVVAAGSKTAIAELVANAPERTRVIELQVAGAFHTHYMAPAVERLAAAASGISPANPTVTLLSNADGAPVASGDDALARLVRQVANPVRWDLCMETMLNLGVTGIIEVAPGGVLTGLAKRVMKGVPAVALKSPEDLDAARNLVEEHA